MSTFVSAMGVSHGINQRWKALSSQSVMSDLIRNYRLAYIIVTSTDQRAAYLEVHLLESTHTDSSSTISDLLIDLPDELLPLTYGTLPPIKPRTVAYSDATRARYTVKSTSMLYGDTLPPNQQDDILLTRTSPTVDYAHFYQHAMVSVNGYWHMTDTDGTSGVYVVDAMKTVRQSNSFQIGVLSFSNIASIQLVPITESMVHRQLTQDMIDGLTPTLPYASEVYVTSTVDLTDKSVFMVIGGYLMEIDGSIIARTSSTDFKINMTQYPLLSRFYESSKYLNLSGVLGEIVNSPIESIDLADIQSDAAILALLTQSTSFMVVVNHPEVYVQRHMVRKELRGRYTCGIQPKYPLQVGNGRCLEYLASLEVDRWTMTGMDPGPRARFFDVADPWKIGRAPATGLPGDPELKEDATLLEIGVDW